MGKEIYEFYLDPTERGIKLVTRIYICVHETPCYYYCNRKGDGNYSWEDRKKYKWLTFKKIHKTASRTASPDKQLAFQKFIYRKYRHRMHLRSTLAIVEEFIKRVEEVDKNYEKFVEKNQTSLLPGSVKIVNEFFRFE